jgi:RNA recognition motif-containing protein
LDNTPILIEVAKVPRKVQEQQRSAHRDHSPVRTVLPAVYIGGMPPSVNAARLAEFFAPHVTVKSAKVMLDDQGVSKGYGFVELPNSSAAEHAVKVLNNTELDGAKVAVRVRQLSPEYAKQNTLITGWYRR